MQTGHMKFWFTIRVILATILLFMAFSKPVVTQSRPAQPYDIYLPLLSKQYSPLPEIKNGDFELGNNGDWMEYSSSTLYYLVGPAIPPTTPPAQSGENLAWLGNIENEVSNLSQSVILPADGPAYLRYYYQIYSDKSNCSLDWMRFLVGAVELESRGLCSAVSTQDWVTDTVDLSAYAGQTITIAFGVTTNSSAVTSSFFIDDVSLIRSP